jgi:hypothetical protein
MRIASWLARSTLTGCALALALALALLHAGRVRAQAATALPRAALDFDAALSSAPYPAAPGPNVAVHVPAGFDVRAPLQLVVYLHGLRGCLPVLLGKGECRCSDGAAPQPGWELGAHHDAAGTNTVFVVPRLVYDRRGGQPGAFAQPGGFRAFLLELLSGPLSARLGRSYALKDLAGITLVAHSAGFETTLAILEHGEVASRVNAVVLLDALYALEDRYARYVLAHADSGLHLVVIHLGGGKPARAGARLQRRLQRALGAEQVASADPDSLRATVAAHRFVFASGRPPHARVPQHHLAEVLASLGLPARAPARQ